MLRKVDNPLNKAAQPMKPATLGNVTRTAGKLFFGLILLVLAVAAGFGGTALIVYHQLGSSRPTEARFVERARPERKEAVRPATPAVENANASSQTRRVTATAADVPAYTYADNNNGQPSLLAKRQDPTVNVPAALDTPRVGSLTSSSPNDPESQYIVDSRTGRVIGIDGSAGARREAEEEQHRLDAAPRAVAVQTPVPEVRVASAVMEEGQPIYHDAAPAATDVPMGSQYVPVRRAMPVNAVEPATEARGFNVAEYLANDQDHSSFQSPYSTGVHPARTTRVFRLPNGTQAVVTD